MKKILVLFVLLFFAFPVYSIETTDSPTEIKLVDNNNQTNSINKVDFNPYMKKVQMDIKNNWKPPHSSDSLRAVAFFSIDKQGNMLDERIKQSSGNTEYDNVVLKAIRKTAPFAALPDEYKGEKIDIEFTFDYNVFMNNQAILQTLSCKMTPNSPSLLVAKSLKNKSDKVIFNKYIIQVSDMLKFVQYKGDGENLVKIKFTIGKDGRVSASKVIASTGNKTFNQEILSKINAMEFGEIPENLKLETLTVEYEFNNCTIYDPVAINNRSKVNTAANTVTAGSALGLLILHLCGH